MSINEESDRRKSIQDFDENDDDDDLWSQDELDMTSDGQSLSAESAESAISADAVSGRSVNVDAISQTVSLDLDTVSRTGSLDVADDT